MERHPRAGSAAPHARARGEQPVSSKLTRDAIAEKTLLELGTERLIGLSDAIDRQADSAQFVEVFRRLASPWGERRVGQRPRHRSSVSDDGAPFEFSIALSERHPELQAYVEALGEPPGPVSNMVAGRAALSSLATDVDASLDRFREIESLFFPDRPQPPFSLWVGASWAPGRGILLKAYLNPQVRGRASAPGLLAECMERLGFRRAWERLGTALSRGPGKDEATIVCLDLSNTSYSRIKIYIRHHAATIPAIDDIAKLAGSYDDNDVATFYSILTGNGGRFLGKAPITELAFVDPAATRPSEVSLEFPIGSYVATDAEARQRILRCLSAFGLPSDTYERAIQAVATRPLDERAGIHAHVTLRRPPASALRVEPGVSDAAPTAPPSLPGGRRSPGPRIAVYFTSEAYVREGDGSET